MTMENHDTPPSFHAMMTALCVSCSLPETGGCASSATERQTAGREKSMRRYDENGKEMVVYTTEELAALQRLPGAGREMTDAEITAAALADPDTVPPSANEAPLPERPDARRSPNCSRRKPWRLCWHHGVGARNRNVRRSSSPQGSTPISWNISAAPAKAGRCGWKRSYAKPSPWVCNI